jgi:hypothetical protein
MILLMDTYINLSIVTRTELFHRKSYSKIENVDFDETLNRRRFHDTARCRYANTEKTADLRIGKSSVKISSICYL